jgi:hypothetical protein
LYLKYKSTAFLICSFENEDILYLTNLGPKKCLHPAPKSSENRQYLVQIKKPLSNSRKLSKLIFDQKLSQGGI